MKKKLAPFYVLLAGVLWGIIGIFVRGFGERGLSSMQIVAIRLGISAVLFSLYALLFKRELFRIKLRDLWCFLGTGVLSVGVFSYCYFQSIALSSLSVASILLYTAPAFVMLFSLLFFREKMTWLKGVALVLAIVGCALATGVFGGAKVTREGLIFGLLSGICYALYSIFSRFALDRGYSPLTITLYTFIFAGAMSLCVIDVRPVAAILTESPLSAMWCVLFAVVSCVLPYLFYTLGLKYIRPSTASIIATVEPVVATVTGALIFGEAVDFPWGYIGIALVLGSVVLVNVRVKREDT